MATTIVAGARTTDLVSSSLIKREVFDAIYNFEPFQTPLVQFFMGNKLAKMQTGNPKFEIQEDILIPRSTVLTGTVSASASEQTVACTTGEGAYFKVGDIIRIAATGENAIITTRDTSNLKFAATDASTALTATTAATTVYKVGSAFAEGSASAVALSTQSTFPYNYTQIFKEAVHMTGTQKATVNYGGDDWVNQRIKATKEWKLQLEQSCMFGIRAVATTSGAYKRFTSGLLDSAGMGISNSSQYVGNDFCTDAYFFQTYCKNLFALGSNKKRLYCGSDALLAINEFQKVKLQTRVAEKQYGYDVTTILTPFGQAELVWHPMLMGAGSAATDALGYSNWVVGVDATPEYFKYRFLANDTENRDMQYQDNIGTVGTDETKAQYLAEIGWHIAGGGQGVHRVLKPGASA